MTDYAEPNASTGFAGLLVCDAMVQRPLTMPAETTVGEARAALDSDRVHQILLVRNGVLVGAVEPHDLEGEREDQPAAAYSHLEGRTVGPHRRLTEVHEEMVASGRRRLAVVNEQGELLGLLCLKRKLTGFCTDEGVQARAADRARTAGHL